MLNRTVLTPFANETIQWLQKEMSNVISKSIDAFRQYKVDAFDAYKVVAQNPEVQMLFGDTLSAILSPTHLTVLNRLLGIGWQFHEDNYYDPTTAFKILNQLTIDRGTESFVTGIFDDYCMDMNFLVGQHLSPRTHFFDALREAEKEYIADEDNMVSVNQTVFGKDQISVHDMRLLKFMQKVGRYNQTTIDHYLKPGFEELIFNEIWHTRYKSHKWTQESYGLIMSRFDNDLEDREVKFTHVLGRLTNDTVARDTICALIANQSDPSRHPIGQEEILNNWVAAIDIASHGGNQPSNYSDLSGYYQDYSARRVAEYYRTHPQAPASPASNTVSDSVNNNIYALFIFLLSLAAIAAVARPSYHALRKAGYFSKANKSNGSGQVAAEVSHDESVVGFRKVSDDKSDAGQSTLRQRSRSRQ